MVFKQNTAHIGLGSNLGDKHLNITLAIDLLTKKDCDKIKQASLYVTEPMGFKHKNQFLNTVIKVKTSLSANDLLQLCQQIEQKLKRIKTQEIGYEARTIDLDILFFNSDIIKEEKLQVPHNELLMRNFVMHPLMEIDPNFIHPKEKKSIKTLFNELDLNTDIEIYCPI